MTVREWMIAFLFPVLGLAFMVFVETDWTLEELKLVTLRPRQATHAYFAQIQARRTAAKLFGTNEEGDQSDAIRHYLWAGLMVARMGESEAARFLSAHETEIESPDSRHMDLLNNQAGLRAAQQLLHQNGLTLQTLERRALADLRAKRLKVNTYRAGPFNFERSE